MAILYALIAIQICLFGVSIYILNRNEKVYDFRIGIIKDVPWGHWWKAKEILDKYTYEDMLYSIKPLKLESWYTDDEIKILTGK